MRALINRFIGQLFTWLKFWDDDRDLGYVPRSAWDDTDEKD